MIWWMCLWVLLEWVSALSLVKSLVLTVKIYEPHRGTARLWTLWIAQENPPLSLLSSVLQVTFLLACGSSLITFVAPCPSIWHWGNQSCPLGEAAQWGECYRNLAKEHRSLKNFHWGLRSSGYWPEFGGDCSHHCPSWLCRGERSIKIGVSMVWFYWFGLNIWVTLYKPTLWALGHKIKDNNTYHTEWLWV